MRQREEQGQLLQNKIMTETSRNSQTKDMRKQVETVNKRKA